MFQRRVAEHSPTAQELQKIVEAPEVQSVDQVVGVIDVVQRQDPVQVFQSQCSASVQDIPVVEKNR